MSKPRLMEKLPLRTPFCMMTPVDPAGRNHLPPPLVALFFFTLRPQKDDVVFSIKWLPFVGGLFKRKKTFQVEKFSHIPG